MSTDAFTRAVIVGAPILAGLVFGLQLQTEYLAAQMNWHPDLGQGYGWFYGYPLYSPHKGIGWFFYLSNDYPSVADTSLVALFVGVLPGFVGGALVRSRLCARRSERPNLGSEKWGTSDDIETAELKEFGPGVFLGRFVDERGKERPLYHNGPDHYLITGVTRVGKTTGVIMPTAFSWLESAIIQDPKEEIFNATASYRREFSDVLVFWPNRLETCRFNCLEEIRPGPLEGRDASLIASAIVEPNKGVNIDYWIEVGRDVVTASILHLLYTAPPERRNLGGLALFMSASFLPEKDEKCHETFVRVLRMMLETKHRQNPVSGEWETHPEILISASRGLQKAGAELSGALSTASNHLKPYAERLLNNATSYSDFALADLFSREKPVTLYINIPPGDLGRLTPFLRIFYSQLVNRITEGTIEGEERLDIKRRLLLMIDEFPALGYMPVFEKAMGLMAGYGVKAMLVAQTVTQIKREYGELQLFSENCNIKLNFRAADEKTADSISRTIGNTTISYTSTSESRSQSGLLFDQAKSKSESKHYSVRRLIAPEEVLRLPRNEYILSVGGAPSLKVKATDYRRDPMFAPLVKPPPSLKRLRDGAWGFSRWNDVPKAQSVANTQTKEKGRRNKVTVTKTDDSSHIEDIAIGQDLIASDLSPFTPSYRFPINDDEEQ